MTIVKKLRCAIYTRKSTEEGLDQDYNSLDAQRDAGEAYIKSQKHEGWQLVPTYYDDGGFSGGNLERPGLKKLLNDIKLNKIDIIVVYKVDRLTRSLHDFAKLVEVFDAHSISFVSVTQSFNTTNSMGRFSSNEMLYRTWFNIADNQKIELLNGVVERVKISLDQLKITLNNDAIEKIENLHRIQKIQFSSIELKSYPTKDEIKFDIQDDLMVCTISYIHQKYRGRKVITDKRGHQINIPKTDKNSGLITAIITAAQCHKNLSEGSCKTIVDLAKKFGRDRSYISKIMKLHYLSPKIKGVIIDGLQPQTTTIQNLLKITNHYDWAKQEQILGV